MFHIIMDRWPGVLRLCFIMLSWGLYKFCNKKNESRCTSWMCDKMQQLGKKSTAGITILDIWGSIKLEHHFWHCSVLQICLISLILQVKLKGGFCTAAILWILDVRYNLYFKQSAFTHSQVSEIIQSLKRVRHQRQWWIVVHIPKRW